jgi:hypothetical protein
VALRVLAACSSLTCGTSRLVHERFFYRFRVSINYRQVGAHRAFWTPAPARWNLERRVCDIKVGVLPPVHDIFVKAYGGSSRVVWGARLAGDTTFVLCRAAPWGGLSNFYI